MPSEKILQQKKEYVASLSQKIKDATAGVLVEYKGINVEQDTRMRKELREANVEYFIVKNTMLSFAAQEAGLNGLEEYLHGTTALALSKDDAVMPAKILTKFAKELSEDTDFSIKAGFMDGEVIDAAMVNQIGSLPSREQLIGQLLSVMIAPIRGLAVALNAVAEQGSAEESTEE